MKEKAEWEAIRDFFREHVESGFTNPLNGIRLSKGNTREHNMRVCEICLTLLEQGIPFYTEVKLKCGLRPDIVTPTHVVKCIEVLHTETETDFIEKKFIKVPESLKGEILLIKTTNQFNPSDVL